MVYRMRIGLISDTHIPEVAQALPPQIVQAFRGVDLILHAGDIYVPSVLDELERIAPVVAAAGDDDYYSTLADKRVEGRHVLKLEGKTVWLVHENPYYYMLASRQAMNSPIQIEHDGPDIVVFGHEHRVIVQRHSGVLFVNPGSPTFLHYRRGLGTIGILDVDSGEAQVRVLQL
jgi:hypothetical protein